MSADNTGVKSDAKRMNESTAALPGSMTWMAIRLSFGSRRPQSHKGDIRKERIVVFTSAAPRCFNRGNVDLLHRHHRLKRALCLAATSPQRLGQSARSDLPGKSPAVLAPTALAFRTAIADDRVPVAVRLFLIVRGDLERKGLGVLEGRAAIETETGNANHGELHRQHVALLAARIITGRSVNSGYFTIRKGGGVEARRLKRVLVEPEADRVLWCHVL
jgi:hypothetical protein